jgi:hypothetical protein
MTCPKISCCGRIVDLTFNQAKLLVGTVHTTHLDGRTLEYNIITYTKESNKNNRVHRYSWLFNTLIHFHQLMELMMTGGLYTWYNNQKCPKLDKILVCDKEWEGVFQYAIVNVRDI